MVTKGKLLAEGKTKKIWEADGHVGLVVVEQKNDITAFDDPSFTKKFGTKAECSITTTCHVFGLLLQAGIPLAFRQLLSPTEFLAERCRMIPLESVARRYAVGSYLKRHPELVVARSELTHHFHGLVTELFLKTTKGRLIAQDGQMLIDGLDPKKGEEDPFIVNPDEPHWSLYHSKKPVWDKDADLERTVLASDVLTVDIQPQEVRNLTRDVFLVLEAAWGALGYRLIDFKIEFGLTADGRLVVADVIDNDSWRLKTSDWQEVSKEAFRQGEALEKVEANYQLVAGLVKQFRIPRQALVLWRGSDKDELPKVAMPFGVEVKEVTLSGHKSPQMCLLKLEELLSDYPEGGVIIVKVGMSNGLGPILASRCTWPVIAVPACLKEFPDDIWSSVRLPSQVPLTVAATDANAISFALNILAQKNPIAYLERQRVLEGLDL